MKKLISTLKNFCLFLGFFVFLLEIGVFYVDITGELLTAFTQHRSQRRRA